MKDASRCAVVCGSKVQAWLKIGVGIPNNDSYSLITPADGSASANLHFVETAL